MARELPIFERAYPDDDCGCPVEEWLCCGLSLMIHFEADGSTEVFVDAGEWDENVPLKARTMDAARDEAFEWVFALPTEDQMANKGHPNDRQ